MKTLELNQMEQIEGGFPWLGAIDCGFALAAAAGEGGLNPVADTAAVLSCEAYGYEAHEEGYI